MNITKVGIEDRYPEYLKRKIILSNQIALILFCLAVGFVFITYIYFRPITYLPLMGVFGSLSTIVFNYLKAPNLARFIISITPISLASIYGAYLSKAGQPFLPASSMIILSFSFIIFIIFDVREKVFLIILSIISLSIMLSLDTLNDLFEMDLDTKIIETGYLAKITVLLSVVSGAGSILLLVFQNKIAEEKASKLLDEAKENQNKMLQKEEELNVYIKKLEMAQQEEQKRLWASNGLTQAMTILRSHSTNQSLYDELISFTVKYTKCVIGALFFLNEDSKQNKFLELVAAYAYERKKYLQKHIQIGEGLVGQVFLEKEYVYLREIPNDYLKITSGLGTSNPNSLLIIPLIANDEVVGVMELASFNPFEKHEIDFLKSLGENIASTYQNIQTNIKTKLLLEKSLQQAEEMRSQEEELKQNMEELAATQEEMVRKEKEYINKIKTLESELEKLQKKISKGEINSSQE